MPSTMAIVMIDDGMELTRLQMSSNVGSIMVELLNSFISIPTLKCGDDVMTIMVGVDDESFLWF